MSDDPHQRNSLTYADAGVSIDAGNQLVDRIGPAVARTTRSGVMGSIGGFGGLFDLRAAGYGEKAVLVAATDGVGTKLRVAIETGDVTGIGVDLVAMCVNDLLCQGAEPLFFLDYFATGHLDPERGAAVVESIAEGCVQAGCALIGGETAEMPGLYHGDDFDLAGFAIGAVDRSALLPKPCGAGDRLIGLPASGAHSNGYSLIRRVVADAGLAWDDQAPFSGADGGAASLGSALLTPTKIYIQAVLPLIRMGQISALAHITGGGLTENLPRVLGDGVSAEIDLTAFQLTGVFRWLSDTAGIAEAEMLRTFNCGVGMVLVVAEEHVAAVQEALIAAGESPIALGALVPHTPGVEAVQYRGSLFG